MCEGLDLIDMKGGSVVGAGQLARVVGIRGLGRDQVLLVPRPNRPPREPDEVSLPCFLLVV